MSSLPVSLVLHILIIIIIIISSSTKPTSATWCVARNDISEDTLQRALDYACGAGADCTPIQDSGPCFLPNTLQAHASYAFNSFYMHAAMDPAACIFSGTATVAKTDPSYGSCAYPASQSTARGTTGMTSPTSGTTLPPPQNGTPLDGSGGAIIPNNMNGTPSNGVTGVVTPPNMEGATGNGSGGALTPTNMVPALDDNPTSEVVTRFSSSRFLVMEMMFGVLLFMF